MLILPYYITQTHSCNRLYPLNSSCKIILPNNHITTTKDANGNSNNKSQLTIFTSKAVDFLVTRDYQGLIIKGNVIETEWKR